MWFRFYIEALDDPKVQKLPAEHFRIWVNLLCVAKKNDGKLPPESDCAFMLRMDNAAFHETFASLINAGLIDEQVGRDKHNEPHNWSKRQYKSDSSTERVKRFRKRAGNAVVTPPETETETEETNATALAKKPDVPDLSQFLKDAARKPKGAKNARPGSRCPADLKATDADREYADSRGLNEEAAAREWESYVAHFSTGQGRNKTATSWHGGNSHWGTWCRHTEQYAADRMVDRPKSTGVVANAVAELAEIERQA